jgi:hypothetical protein
MLLEDADMREVLIGSPSHAIGVEPIALNSVPWLADQPPLTPEQCTP